MTAPKPGVPSGDPHRSLPYPQAWDEPTAKLLDPIKRVWELEGFSPIPDPVLIRLESSVPLKPGRDGRLATFGHIVRIHEYDFPGVGVHTVVVCEKAALVYLPESAPPFDVQGVQLSAMQGLGII